MGRRAHFSSTAGRRARLSTRPRADSNFSSIASSRREPSVLYVRPFSFCAERLESWISEGVASASHATQNWMIVASNYRELTGSVGNRGASSRYPNFFRFRRAAQQSKTDQPESDMRELLVDTLGLVPRPQSVVSFAAQLAPGSQCRAPATPAPAREEEIERS